MRKVCFLDVDGVLNSYTTKDRITEEEITTSMRPGPYMGALSGGDTGMIGIERELVERLNRILASSPEIEVIVSSTWRKLFSMEALKRILATRGFIGNITGETPTQFGGNRGREIALWLGVNPEVKTFVILEDGLDIHPELYPNWVNTDYRSGLTEADVQKAIQILTTPPVAPAELLYPIKPAGVEQYRVRQWKDAPPDVFPYEISFDGGLTWTAGVEAMRQVKFWTRKITDEELNEELNSGERGVGF